MPRKGQSLIEAYNDWKAKAVPDIHCDISFHVAVTWFGPDTLDEMTTLTQEHGVQSYKFFLAYKNVLQVNDEELIILMRHCRKLGALASVHAENGDLIADMSAELVEQGVTGPEGHSLSRQEQVEGEATHRAIEVAAQANCPLYIVHCMSESALGEIAKAKRRGLNVYGEALAAALACDGRELYNPDWRHAAGYVMSPPLRDDPNTKNELFKALVDGRLDIVATDNCTFNGDQKVWVLCI